MRARLIIGTVLVVALAFALSGLIIHTLMRAQIYAQFDDNLTSRAHTLAARIEQANDELDLEDLAREDTANEYFQVWRVGGDVVARSRSLGQRQLAYAPSAPLVTSIASVEFPNGDRGRQATFVFNPAHDPDETTPGPPITVALAVARPTSELDRTSARLAEVLLAVGLAASLACAALLTMVVQLGLRPVRRLAAAISSVREGDLSMRIEVETAPSELRPVVERLNELLERLESAFKRERDLTAEVAHELRTPIAGLRATIELALTRERTPERYRSALAECLAICTQTERTVEALLSLARLDAGAVRPRYETFDLADLAQELIATHDARARERGLTIESKLTAATIESDRGKLHVIAQNLLDNAISYSDEGGKITVETAADRLVIANTGCRLEPGNAAKVFDRFWRADQSRSSSTGHHAGLGLALSKKLAELLGGTLAVEVRDRLFIATVAIPPRHPTNA